MSIRIWKLSKVEWPCELCDKTILVGYCEGHEVSTNCKKKNKSFVNRQFLKRTWFLKPHCFVKSPLKYRKQSIIWSLYNMDWYIEGYDIFLQNSQKNVPPSIFSFQKRNHNSSYYLASFPDIDDLDTFFVFWLVDFVTTQSKLALCNTGHRNH